MKSSCVVYGSLWTDVGLICFRSPSFIFNHSTKRQLWPHVKNNKKCNLLFHNLSVIFLILLFLSHEIWRDVDTRQMQVRRRLSFLSHLDYEDGTNCKLSLMSAKMMETRYYEGCGREGPIRCIFLGEFHPVAGPKVSCQVMTHCLCKVKTS